MTKDDDNADMDSTKHSNFYNGAKPWSPPQNSGEAIFHEPANQAEAPPV
jgi:hypothetical protein